MEKSIEGVQRRIALVYVGNNLSRALQCLSAAPISLEKGASGVVDPETSRRASACHIRFCGRLALQAQDAFALHELNLFPKEPVATSRDISNADDRAGLHKSLWDLGYHPLSDLSHYGTTGVDEIVSSSGTMEAVLPANQCDQSSAFRRTTAVIDLIDCASLSRRQKEILKDEVLSLSPDRLIGPKIAERLLGYDAIIFHLDRQHTYTDAMSLMINDIISNAIAQTGELEPNVRHRLEQIIVAFSDAGFSLMKNGNTAALLPLCPTSLEALCFDDLVMRHAPTIQRLSQFVDALDARTSSGPRIEFIGIPIDLDGDISQIECLNRDPINEEKSLLSALIDEPVGDMHESKWIRENVARELWRPFNLADPFLAAAEHGVRSNTAFDLKV